jgi:hypothetical protein
MEVDTGPEPKACRRMNVQPGRRQRPDSFNYIIPVSILPTHPYSDPLSAARKEDKNKKRYDQQKIPLPSNLLPYFTVIALWTLTDYHQHLPPP